MISIHSTKLHTPLAFPRLSPPQGCTYTLTHTLTLRYSVIYTLPHHFQIIGVEKKLGYRFNKCIWVSSWLMQTGYFCTNIFAVYMKNGWWMRCLSKQHRRMACKWDCHLKSHWRAGTTHGIHRSQWAIIILRETHIPWQANWWNCNQITLWPFIPFCDLWPLCTLCPGREMSETILLICPSDPAGFYLVCLNSKCIIKRIHQSLQKNKKTFWTVYGAFLHKIRYLADCPCCSFLYSECGGWLVVSSSKNDKKNTITPKFTENLHMGLKWHEAE